MTGSRFKTSLVTMLATAALFHARPARAEGRKERTIDTAQPARVYFHRNQTVWEGTLEQMDASGIKFLPRCEVAPHPVLFKPSNPRFYAVDLVRAVEVADDYCVYNREKGRFESGLEHYVYNARHRAFEKVAGSDLPRPVVSRKRAVVSVEHFPFLCVMSLLESNDVALSLLGPGPSEIPARKVDYILSANAAENTTEIWHYSAKTGLFKRTTPERERAKAARRESEEELRRKAILAEAFGRGFRSLSTASEH